MFRFIRQVIRNVLVIVATYTLVLLLAFALLAWALRSREGTAAAVPDQAVLVVDLGFSLSDSPRDPSWRDLLRQALSDRGVRSVSLRQWVGRLDRAAADPRISALYLHGNLEVDGYGSSFASLAEARRAVERFRASGKPVIAWLYQPTLREYFLCSAASEIALHPGSVFPFNGIAFEMLFFGDAFSRLGVEVQPVVVGRYKSAPDMFTRREMSPDDRASTAALAQALWDSLAQAVAASRGFDRERIEALARDPGLLTAQEALQAGLVDRVAPFDQVLQSLEAIAGTDPDLRSFRQVAFTDYPEEQSRAKARKGETEVVAVVYAEGEVVSGFGEEGQVGADRLGRELRRLRKDDTVKAVVLRVNSPGGSSQAAEVILRELELLKQTKPLVVSIGGLGASAGYWMASVGNVVLAEPNSITGSIGVFLLLLSLDQATGKIGVHFDGVKTHPRADVMHLSRARSDEEVALFERFALQVYDDFTNSVARHRGLPLEQVLEVAEGRVWSGQDALSVGLVDRLGGLQDAVEEAVKLAGLDRQSFELREFPRQQNLGALVARWLGLPEQGGFYRSASLHRLLRQVDRDLERMARLQDPRDLYLRLPYDLRIP